MNPECSFVLCMNPHEEERIDIRSSANPNPAATTGERANPNPVAATGGKLCRCIYVPPEVEAALRRLYNRRLLNPNGEFSRVWSTVLILICGFAVSADPLFLYIPIVNKDIKCTGLDAGLKFNALVLRSLTDLFYVYDIIWKVIEDRINRWRIIKQWLPIGVLAVAPIPQVVILSFPKIIRIPSFSRILLNSLVVLQYAIRVGRIYQLRKKLEKHITQDTPIKWFKGVRKFWISGSFIIFEFTLASHVFGALWYFFSFQRLMGCWKYACRNENGCELGGFYCEDKDTFMRNVTLLNNLCHANPPTATSFDFGIFLDAIQSGILSSTDFPQKFLHCFWWGLRNLSSFGQNLQTSSYAWEDLFAVLINVIGMLLVLIYLNAIVQMHAQSTAALSNEREMRKKRNPQIASWLDENGLPLDLKEKLMTCALNELKADEDIDIKNIRYILPLKDLINIKRHLCLDTLKKVTKLQNMKEKEFEAFCEYLMPVIHEAEHTIIQEGEQFDKLLFITQGTVRTYTTTSDDGRGSSSAGNTLGDGCLQKGDFHGEELVQAWELYGGTTSRSTKNVTCGTKVEGFTLTIKDMKRGIEKIRE